VGELARLSVSIRFDRAMLGRVIREGMRTESCDTAFVRIGLAPETVHAITRGATGVDGDEPVIDKPEPPAMLRGKSSASAHKHLQRIRSMSAPHTLGSYATFLRPYRGVCAKQLAIVNGKQPRTGLPPKSFTVESPTGKPTSIGD
jgi:hypothetical protein